MIENDKQYKISKQCLKAFKKALQDFEEGTAHDDLIDPRILKAQKDAVKSHIDELQAEIDAYDAAKDVAKAKENIRYFPKP